MIEAAKLLGLTLAGILILIGFAHLGLGQETPTFEPADSDQVIVEMQRQLDRLQGELDVVRDLQNVRYTPDGVIYLEGQARLDRDTKHTVIGRTKLVAGMSIIQLNTNTGGGRSNVSFTSALSYTGSANQIDTGVHKTYSVVPIGPDRFCVESSDNTDTATVIFFVAGE